jgi:hypothetical protein
MDFLDHDRVLDLNEQQSSCLYEGWQGQEVAASGSAGGSAAGWPAASPDRPARPEGTLGLAVPPTRTGTTGSAIGRSRT